MEDLLMSRDSINTTSGGNIHSSLLTITLQSHPNLNPDDIQYAVGVISGMGVSDVELARFTMQTYQLTNTGRYSLTYNYDLDYHIKNRVPSRIQTLVRGARSREAWPELYDNSFLSQNQIRLIDDISNLEYATILKSIKEGKLLSISDKTNNTDEKITVDEDVYYNSIYSKCYDQVCVTEARQRGKIVSLLDPQLPKLAYVSDPSSENIKECFDLMLLISRFANGNYMNPKSNRPFSDRTTNQILTKYDKEIKMYKKHLEIMMMNKM